MTLLSFCPRCLAYVRLSYDQTPSPECRVCAASGYVTAKPEEKRAYWQFVSANSPRR